MRPLSTIQDLFLAKESEGVWQGHGLPQTPGRISEGSGPVTAIMDTLMSMIS